VKKKCIEETSLFLREKLRRVIHHKAVENFFALTDNIERFLIEKKSFFSLLLFRRRFLLVTDLESINNCIMSRCPFFFVIFFAAIIRHYMDERICRVKRVTAESIEQ
jgi:hypothetical protein